MNGADYIYIIVVDTVLVELLEVEVKDPADIVVYVVCRFVLTFLLALYTKNLSRQVLLVRIVFSIVDGVVESSGQLRLRSDLRCYGHPRLLLSFLLGGKRLLIL